MLVANRYGLGTDTAMVVRGLVSRVRCSSGIGVPKVSRERPNLRLRTVPGLSSCFAASLP